MYISIQISHEAMKVEGREKGSRKRWERETRVVADGKAEMPKRTQNQTMG